jgi:hypothetical protein
MARRMTDQEKAAFLSMLKEAMLALRDNKKGFEDDSQIGTLIERRRRYGSKTNEYFVFKNDRIKDSEISMKTKINQSEFPDDEIVAPGIPIEFEANFISPVSGVSIDEIKKITNVEEYWIDDNGDRYVPPTGGLQISPRGTVFLYRYSAKQTPEARFSVTVFVIYLAPAQADARDGVRWLNSVTIARD